MIVSGVNFTGITCSLSSVQPQRFPALTETVCVLEGGNSEENHSRTMFLANSASAPLLFSEKPTLFTLPVRWKGKQEVEDDDVPVLFVVSVTTSDNYTIFRNVSGLSYREYHPFAVEGCSLNLFGSYRIGDSETTQNFVLSCSDAIRAIIHRRGFSLSRDVTSEEDWAAGRHRFPNGTVFPVNPSITHMMLMQIPPLSRKTFAFGVNVHVGLTRFQMVEMLPNEHITFLDGEETHKFLESGMPLNDLQFSAMLGSAIGLGRIGEPVPKRSFLWNEP